MAYTVLLGVIVSGRPFHVGSGAVEFLISFFGGGLLGVVAGRVMLELIPWTRDDRLAVATLTVALAYLSFIAADRFFDVSGVVAVLTAGLTVSAFGKSRIAPYNWSFLDGPLGAARLLGAFARLPAGVDPGAEAFLRPSA